MNPRLPDSRVLIDLQEAVSGCTANINITMTLLSSLKLDLKKKSQCISLCMSLLLFLPLLCASCLLFTEFGQESRSVLAHRTAYRTLSEHARAILCLCVGVGRSASLDVLVSS